MTKAEARKQLGLKETDDISRAGVETLVESLEKQLQIGWRMNKQDKAEIEKNIEACKALIS